MTTPTSCLFRVEPKQKLFFRKLLRWSFLDTQTPGISPETNHRKFTVKVQEFSVILLFASDVKSVDGFFNMSTVSGEGVEEVLAELLRLREELKVEEVAVDIRAVTPKAGNAAARGKTGIGNRFLIR